jgi:hypothetical protein
VHHGFGKPIAQRLFQDLIVPERLVVGVQEDVRMRVDQSGEQRGAGEIDRLGVGGRVHRCRGADCGD